MIVPVKIEVIPYTSVAISPEDMQQVLLVTLEEAISKYLEKHYIGWSFSRVDIAEE